MAAEILSDLRDDITAAQRFNEAAANGRGNPMRPRRY